MKRPTLHVVVDGSNLATEGRTTPSLAQLDDCVRSFMGEYPSAEIIVVVDASFEHRVAPSERARFKEAELAGEIVTPPAGAVGRGDGFILKIAQRIDAVVLSNDSFQEFHDAYPWLFEIGRLVGGKPVKGVGWIFTDRIPVRGSKSDRTVKAPAKAVKKLAATRPDGAKPSIGDTLTPIKATKVAKITKVAKVAVKKTVKEPPAKTDPKSDTKVEKKVAKKVAKKAVPEVPAESTTPVAARRTRQPVNPHDAFTAFVKSTKIGGKLEGTVKAFTSHGAVITVTMKNGTAIECYAPTTNLASPPPTRARDVLKRGDVKAFVLVTVDSERRIAELGL